MLKTSKAFSGFSAGDIPNVKVFFTLALVTFVIALPIVANGQSPTPTPPAPQKAILVTGASTGIGRKVTERLAADGYFVYAGARKDADLEGLNKIKNVQAVRLDVTKQEDIDAAVATIKNAGRGLYGLINNAGVATLGTLAATPYPEFELTMMVNTFGPWRVTKAFAPLIIAEKGRIATTSSISGVLAGPTLGAYAMSKHAIEGFTDSLAAEMEPLGVHVIAVEPGTYKSEIVRSAAQRLGGKASEHANDFDKFNEPDDVAAAFAAAFSDPKPKRRYMVVPVEDQARITIKRQITQLVELNEGQTYTYDREALIKMLDEALAGSRPRTK